MIVTMREAAEADLEDAFDYYESVRRGLGDELLEAFRRAVESVVRHPDAWQPLDAEFRRRRLHRFPYGIIYRIDPTAAEVVIVAVQHLHRRPDAWRKRP